MRYGEDGAPTPPRRVGVRAGGYQVELLTPRSHPPPVGSRRLLGIAWSDWLAVLTLAGIVLYGMVAFAYSRFYGELGITPGEVGLGYAEVIRRASVNGIVLLSFVAVASVLGSFGGDPSKDHRRAAYVAGAGLLLLLSLVLMLLLVRVLQVAASAAVVYAGLVVAAAVLLGVRAAVGPSVGRQYPYLGGALVATLRAAPADAEAARRRRQAWMRLLLPLLVAAPVFTFTFVQLFRSAGVGPLLASLPFLLVIVGPLAVSERRARRLRDALLPPPMPVIVALAGVLAMTILATASAVGSNAAARVDAFQPPVDAASSIAPWFLDVQAAPVCVLWLGPMGTPRPPGVSHELVYLGQADGTTVLYDTTTHGALRLPSSALATYTLPSPVASTTRPIPRACPSS
jgi:hypothetical protein